MKSINTKIIVILGIGLLFQIIIVGSFYQLAITKKVIYEINNNANNRQSMLSGVVKKIESMASDVPQMQNYLLQYSQNNNVDFKIKDLEGKIIYVTTFTDVMNKKIEDRVFIELNNKPKYVVYAYFPTKIENMLISIKGTDTKIILSTIVIAIATIMSLVIYWIIGKPLKKLRNAMANMNYGNTEVVIPYYASDEIGQLCRNLEDMGHRLKKSEDNQRQMILAISHDLKTPLTSMIGYVRRLYDGKVNNEEKRSEYYEILNRKTMDLKYLIDELDDFASLYQDSKYNFQKIELKEMLDYICKELEVEAKQREKHFSFNNQINGEYFIFIEEGKIRRVIANIIGNSFKYAGENGDIFLNCTTKTSYVVFEIGDKGKGVLESELDKIFDKFYRVETSRSREMGGTGLGLAICKDIIQSHNGEIWAENNNFGGLSVIFTLPINEKIIK
jgi:signal transduction histidine kinase